MTVARTFTTFSALVVSLAGSVPAWADEIEECAAAAEKGQELRDQGQLVDARARLVRCAQSTCPKMVRADCERWLPEIEGRIPTVVLHATDDAGGDVSRLSISRDGVPWLDHLDGTAIPMNPGATKLHVTAPGYESLDREIVIVEGQRGRLVELTLKRVKGADAAAQAAPSSTDAAGGGGPGPWPWVALGVGVAGLGAFTVTQILASGDVSDVEAGCGRTKTCTDAELDPIRTKLTVSAFGLGVGIAGVGASIALFALLSGDDASEGASVHVTPIVGPGVAAATIDVPLGL